MHSCHRGYLQHRGSSVKKVMEDIWTTMIIEATWVTDTTQDTEIPEVMEALKVIEYIHVMKATWITLLNQEIEGAQAIETMKDIEGK